jgi:hypothetical protein
VSSLARQSGGSSGPTGHLATWLLARGNAAFNRWLAHELSAAAPAPATVIELRRGSGIALHDHQAPTPPPTSSASTRRQSCTRARDAPTHPPPPMAACP